MNSYEHTSREFLPLSVIRSACAGDTDAVEQVLQHYRGYILYREKPHAHHDYSRSMQSSYSAMMDSSVGS